MHVLYGSVKGDSLMLEVKYSSLCAVFFFTSYEIPVEHSTQDEAGHVRVSCVWYVYHVQRGVRVRMCVLCSATAARTVPVHICVLDAPMPCRL